MKKAVSMLLVLVMIFSLLGCNRQSGKAGDTEAAPQAQNTAKEETEEVETEPVFYSKKEYPMPAGCSVRGIARIDDRLMLSGYQDGVPMLAMTDYEIPEGGVPQFGETELLPLDIQPPYNESVYCVTAGGDGCFYVLAGEHAPIYMRGYEVYTNEDYQGRIAILQYSPQGELLDKMEIPAWQEGWASCIVVDASKRVYLMGTDYVSSFPWQTEDISTIRREDTEMYSMQLTAQGVVLAMNERDAFKYFLMESPDSLRELSFKDPGENRTVSVPNWCTCQGLEGEYIVSSEGRFVACDVERGSTRELYQWSYSAYIGSCEFACRLSENFFICTLVEDYMLVTGLVEQPVTEKSTVKVALYDMGNSNAVGCVNELNMKGGPYVYEITEYGKDEEQRLLADLAAGGKIDLIIFNNNLDVSSAAYEDLYGYIDSEADMGREDFIPGILEALSDGEQLHELWAGVSVDTLAARASDVEGRENLSPQDYLEIMEQNDRYEAVFMTFMDKLNMLKWVAQLGAVKYIDRENARCSFDEPSFAQLLAWCGTMGDTVEEGSDVPYLELSQVVLSVEPISNPARLKSLEELFGEPCAFVGFPDGGSGFSCFNCDYGGSMAIPANSSNKEGAWAFIKEQLSMDKQMDMEYCLPVNRQALLRRAEEELSGEQVERLMGLLENTRGADRCSDSQVRDIILECGQAYLAGDKSLEETVELIQSRASIYVSEQYG